MMDSKKTIDFDESAMEMYKLIGQIRRDIDIFFYSQLGLLACAIITAIIVLLE